MSRYIDAELLKADIRKAFPSLQARTEINIVVNSQPTIDIVTCKECKFSARYVDDGHIECRLYSHPLRHDYHEMKPDDYCSYGDKRDD